MGNSSSQKPSSNEENHAGKIQNSDCDKNIAIDETSQNITSLTFLTFVNR